MTCQWLTEHHLPAGELVMHPGDYANSPTREFKRRALLEIARKHRVVVVVDDDPAVVALLRSNGFTVELATWCPYIPLARGG